MANNFADRLASAVQKKSSPVCVGLDPRTEMLPPGVGVIEFCRRVIEAVEPFAAAVKPQVAFFEEWPAGLDMYREVCTLARSAGLIVIADVKRGDIADTAEAYARAHVEKLEADAITVNPYMGGDTLKPFLDKCADLGKGLFVVVKTSNASSGDFQDLEVAPGEPLYVRVAKRVREWGAKLRGTCGYSSIGIVVGATHREQAARLRRECPDLWFLVPGFGAQGATAEDVKVCVDSRGGGGGGGGLGAIINASRSVIYAYQKAPEVEWSKAVSDAARKMRDALRF